MRRLARLQFRLYDYVQRNRTTCAMLQANLKKGHSMTAVVLQMKMILKKKRFNHTLIKPTMLFQ